MNRYKLNSGQKMNRKMLCTTPFLLVLVSGCAGMSGGLGSTDKTNQLELGMSASEVKHTLGEPSQTQFIADKWGWNYSLHQILEILFHMICFLEKRLKS